MPANARISWDMTWAEACQDMASCGRPHTCWICYRSTRWKPECLETSTPQPPGATKLVIAGGCTEKNVAHPWKWCFTKWLIQPTYSNKTCSWTLDISRSNGPTGSKASFHHFRASSSAFFLACRASSCIRDEAMSWKKQHVLNHRTLDHLKDLSEHHQEMVMFTPYWHEKNLCNLAPSSFFSCFARVDPLHKFWR